MIRLTDFQDDLSEDFGPLELASRLHCISGKAVIAESNSTTFGFILEGTCRIKWNEHSLELRSGMYFSIAGQLEFSGNAKIACFIRNNFFGLTNIGGPIEKTGRLKYINNCTDTLLISPPRLGDPCLNLLVFPANTLQDKHIHPSLRLGIVASGSGFCHSSNQRIPLRTGSVFSIPANTVHCFETTNDTLRVIAYHPDSDQGPTDEAHPMINRTILNF